MPHFLHKINNATIIVGGVEVCITLMTQFLTYTSLIEGIFSIEDNLQIIGKASGQLKRFTGVKESYVIKPRMVPVPEHISRPHDLA